MHLAEDLRDAIVAGDIEAARIAHGAIGQLLGTTNLPIAQHAGNAHDDVASAGAS